MRKNQTPGPWVVRKSRNEIVIHGHNSNFRNPNSIVCIMGLRPSREENAKLISSAPELKECLKEIVSCIHMPMRDIAPHLERAHKLLEKLGVWEEK